MEGRYERQCLECAIVLTTLINGEGAVVDVRLILAPVATSLPAMSERDDSHQITRELASARFIGNTRNIHHTEFTSPPQFESGVFPISNHPIQPISIESKFYVNCP